MENETDMTWLFMMVLALSVAYIWYLLDKIAVDQKRLAAYRAVVLEWTLYMHEKNNAEDFALWRKELNE
jgi:hypothetical protein